MNILLGGAAIYGAVVGGLYLFQDSLIFPRHATSQPRYPLPQGNERLELRTQDGHKLVGNLLRTPGASEGLLISFSGNAWNADDHFVFLTNRLKNVDIAVFHYRGYAPSSGKPGEKQFFEDALLIHDTLVAGMKPHKVFSSGFSIGTGVASYLAGQRSLHGVLLVTPFDSVQAVAKARYSYVPISTLLKHPFRSDLHLDGVDVPVAIITASDDKVVPVVHADALRKILKRNVFHHNLLDSNHASIYDREEIDDLLRIALLKLSEAS